LNAGLNHCSGRWIARMDSDDRSLPNRFKRQLGFIESNPGLVAVSCWAHYIGPSGRRIALGLNDLTTLEAYLGYMSDRRLIELPHPGAFISRQTLRDMGAYRPDYEPAEDVDLWNRLSERGGVLAVPECLLEYRLHPASLVTTRLRLAQLKREWAKASMLARRSASAEPPWDQFLNDWYSAPLPKRLDRERQLLADGLLRKGREQLAAGQRLRGLCKITLGLVLRPARSAPRVLRQFRLALSRIRLV
jgi:glycosyltransferase involved in cell wall biosynthesis